MGETEKDDIFSPRDHFLCHFFWGGEGLFFIFIFFWGGCCFFLVVSLREGIPWVLGD